MNRHRCLALMVAGLALSGDAAVALGELITFEFAGEITSVQDDYGLLGGAVTIGTPFSGLYTFESTTPDMWPYSLETGVYPATMVVAGHVGEFQFSGITGTADLIVIGNGSPLDPPDSYLTSWSVDFAGQPAGAGIELVDNTGIAFSRDSLPLSPPRLSRFDERTFGIGAGGEIPHLGLLGEITSLTPEPGTLTLLALGALVLGRRRRMRMTQRA